jgi:hypothetical protein
MIQRRISVQGEPLSGEFQKAKKSRDEHIRITERKWDLPSGDGGVEYVGICWNTAGEERLNDLNKKLAYRDTLVGENKKEFYSAEDETRKIKASLKKKEAMLKKDKARDIDTITGTLVCSGSLLGLGLTELELTGLDAVSKPRP